MVKFPPFCVNMPIGFTGVPCLAYAAVKAVSLLTSWSPGSYNISTLTFMEFLIDVGRVMEMCPLGMGSPQFGVQFCVSMMVSICCKERLL